MFYQSPNFFRMNLVIKSNVDSIQSEVYNTQYCFRNLQTFMCVQVCLPYTQVISLIFWTLTKVRIIACFSHQCVCDKHGDLMSRITV